MVFTHVLVGLLVAVVAGGGAPGGPLLLAGAVGGLLPDLDMVAAHRRTLHFPVGYPVAAALAGFAWVATGTPAALLAAVLLAAAAVHSLMDPFGAGLELRPWNRDSQRAVYNHALGRWHRPRRVVYDGSPGDAALCVGIAAVAAALGGPDVRLAAVTLAGLGVTYALVRRRLADVIPEEFQSLSPFLKHLLARGWRAIRGRTGKHEV